MKRAILHCDMNNFYATVEVKMNPELEGKPVVVGGSKRERHGIVLAKSYEAKKFGVRTGETLNDAISKCPELIVVPPHFDEYLLISNEAREIYNSFTDKVESYGIDECWLDISGTEGLFGSPYEVGMLIKEKIKEEIGVTVSVGVSFNKIFAKLCSDLAGRDEIREVWEEDFRKIIWPLPVGCLLGVGYATRKKLAWYGIKTIGDLAKVGEDFMRSKFGKNGWYLYVYANGYDVSRVAGFGERAPVKSVGHGTTLVADVVDEEIVYGVMLELSLDVGYRMAKLGVRARGVELTIRDSSLAFFSFQCRLDFPSSCPSVLANAGRSLFRAKYAWAFPVRAITIRGIDLVSEVVSGVQLDLIGVVDNMDRFNRIGGVLSDVRDRFGRGSLSYGVLLSDNKVPEGRRLDTVMPSGIIR
ncbi:MAG: DNA polymerase IV [Firmicutes bacterium]|nr:DNA polymerase IV [Bacillota bacterium]